MKALLRPAVFLDRDGVINDVVVRDGKSHPPSSADALELYACAPAAIAALSACGFAVIVVTNQPDVATGVQSAVEVERMHRRLLAELAIDAIFACFHIDADACVCRKPRPGMLLDAAERYAIDLRRSFMVGDRWRDIEAGASAGCTTLWIDRGYRERAPVSPDFTVADLGHAARIITHSTPRRDAEAGSLACAASPRAVCDGPRHDVVPHHTLPLLPPPMDAKPDASGPRGARDEIQVAGAHHSLVESRGIFRCSES